jgi:hypothetical protein
MARPRVLTRLVISLAFVGTTAIGVAGCVLVPVPDPVVVAPVPPVIVAPRRPVIVAPAPHYGYQRHGPRHGYWRR